MKIFWSPLSLRKIDSAAQIIAKDKPIAAKMWVKSIFKAVERIKKFPASGRPVPEVKSANVREIISGNYRIIYRLGKNRVFILTVRHSRQLLQRSNLTS